jgi:hypothetical protein
MTQDVRKPRLATALPPPPELQPRELEEATREARALRVRLDQAAAGMETLQGSDERIRLR